MLFLDIVGYSKLLISEQSKLLHTLKEIGHGTEQFWLAQAEGKLLPLPTGVGVALVFRTSPEAPVLCALEISKALESHPELPVRMCVDRSLMLVTALSPVIGYDKSSKIAHCALDEDLTLKEAALKLSFVTEDDFNHVVDPAKMVRPYVAQAT